MFMGPLLERPAVHRTVDDLLEAAAAGEIQVVIDRTSALQDASKAHNYAETGRPLGRVIMTP
ncbi:Zn-dependent alcohol dehydrogenase domain-containing protein (plasmid) [Rhizobium sp. N541]|nr:Zn-dependent alcohol dehydrogenase domain-containing protein [Rhizobium sp. N541]ANM26095.1 Zn-dependent alcohol dehydrogenase domain-containing protein [Rhizobium sp. N941]